MLEHPTTAKDIYRLAQVLLDRHGDDAVFVAAKIADDLGDQGDTKASGYSYGMETLANFLVERVATSEAKREAVEWYTKASEAGSHYAEYLVLQRRSSTQARGRFSYRTGRSRRMRRRH